VKVSGRGSNPATVRFAASQVTFTANGVNYNLAMPGAEIIFSESTTTATTKFEGGKWVTTVPANYTGNVFLSGTAFPVPAGGLPVGINPVTWSGYFLSDTPGISAQWKWAAAVYELFSLGNDALGVKAIDGSAMNPYANSDHAGTPENFKPYVTGGARGGGGSNYTGGYSGTASATAYLIAGLKNITIAPAVTIEDSVYKLQLGEGDKNASIKSYRLLYETDARKMEKRDTVVCHSGSSGIGCATAIEVASTGSLSGLINPPSTDALYFYHTDHLGTPIMMTDKDQNVVWEGEFLPFGEPFSVTGTITNNLRFPGQYYDVETGLNQNWHRDYKAEIGRYVEKDPIGVKGGINGYQYVRNNPNVYLDVTGLKVTITILRDIITDTSIGGTISVNSSIVSDTFNGYTLEPIRAKGPVPTGWYDAFLRTDHDPWRIELSNVLGNNNIQIHNGNTAGQSTGCFLVGTFRLRDFVGDSVLAMRKILSIITKDCSGDIGVDVGWRGDIPGEIY